MIEMNNNVRVVLLGDDQTESQTEEEMPSMVQEPEIVPATATTTGNESEGGQRKTPHKSQKEKYRMIFKFLD